MASRRRAPAHHRRRGGRGGDPPADRRRLPGPLSLEDIHGSLPTAATVDLDGCYYRPRNAVPVETSESKGRRSTTATPATSTPFHEALNEYLLTARPRTGSDVRDLAGLVVRLAGLCCCGASSASPPDANASANANANASANASANANAWKLFLLAAFHRRYHARSPTAKEESIVRPGGGPEGDDGERGEATAGGGGGDGGDAVGDGERLVFYVTCLTLNRLAKLEKEDGRAGLLEAAALAMVEVSPYIGGTRDVTALIEHLTYQTLSDRGHVRFEMVNRANAPRNFDRSALLPALRTMLRLGNDGEGVGRMDPPLVSALGIAATLLDGDLAKCIRGAGAGAGAGGKEDENEDDDELTSTIHVTLPHRDRGSSRGSSFQRKLSNCVAEILVWQRTEACRSDERFSQALAELRSWSKKRDRAEEKGADADFGHDQLMRMQTTARKKRKVLNDAARLRGYMLCSLYLKDRTLLTFGQVRRGKAGDLSMLKKLASKSGDRRVLKMLAARCADPSKATSIESVGALVKQWRDIHPTPDEGSVEALELELQVQTVRATLDKLRSKVRAGSGGDGGEVRRVLVTALGRRKADAACAILVAAALQPHSRLLIQSEERDMSSEEEIMEALNDVIIGEFANASNSKSAQEVLEEEMSDFRDAVFVSCTDVEVDETALKRLQADGKTVRVHSTSRVESVEPLKIELDDEISDRLRSGCPVSVAVLLDCTGSMGREIEGCKEGALRAIDAFNDLAPVKCACFLGYWDPVNSSGDPDPRSTGFLDPRSKENLEEIQHFVNTKLPCTGGGDEPEDIPAALEKLLGDMKSAGLSSEDGVHFVFFIADAGYRHTEDERVSSLLRQLYQLGVVMVMCPVRSYGTCETLVAKNQEVFRPGKYIQVQGVSALKTIASSVTESIRASLFKQGNVASVTASVGETMESLWQLCVFQEDHSKMKRVAEVSTMPSEIGDGTEDGALDGDEEGGEEEMRMSGDPKAAEESDKDAGSQSDQSVSIFVRPNTFSVTNFDRIYIQMSRLPKVCHRVVEGAFGGGKSLQEVVAIDIANRLVKEATPVSELKESGYPPSIVELVRNTMGGHGLCRQHQAEQMS